MALVTIRILDGPERGKTFQQIATPVSVGREDGNFIQLNDERVSRYHFKILEDAGAIVLSDLQSTNGTRVNGETVHTWRIKPGDLISAGRSVMLFGTSEEIVQRLADIRHLEDKTAVTMGNTSSGIKEGVGTAGMGGVVQTKSSEMLLRGICPDLSPQDMTLLQSLSLSKLPTNLTPQQNALLEEFLQYLHLRLRHLVSTVRFSPEKILDNSVTTSLRVTVSAPQWQNIVDLYGRIAEILNNLPEP